MEQTSAQTTPIDWKQPQGLVGLSFKIFFLRIVTLGIYHFWGKTQVRRDLWQATHLAKQPLEYTGTGKELFLGFLIVFFLFIIPLYGIIFAAAYVFGQTSVETLIIQYVIIFLMFFLIGVAVYRSRRYRLSRTRWRGIRGTMTGSPWAFGWTYFWTTLLVPLTLGWIIPWRDAKLERTLVSETAFGDVNLEFDGSSKGLWGPFAITWFGMMILIPVIGGICYLIYTAFGLGPLFTINNQPTIDFIILIYGGIFLWFIAVTFISSFYISAMLNKFAAATSLTGQPFSLTTSPMSLFGLTFTNLLIAIFTIGILVPIIQARFLRYFVNRLEITGPVDFDRIAQNQSKMDQFGEGLAEAFDIDAL